MPILVSDAGISIVAPSIVDVTLADWKRGMVRFASCSRSRRAPP
jgi:hypothetical protein